MSHSSTPLASPQRTVWLFSPAVDLSVFLGSAVVSLLLLWVGAAIGVLHSDSPGWTWVTAVLLIDVAHVYSTAFRVYFDVEELKRRMLLYVAVPICGFVVSWALYSEGELLFWRVLAYLAVFHFVRQQYGWVALYRAKAHENVRWERYIDNAAIYLATIYPLIYWHTGLPRQFQWFAMDRGELFFNFPATIAQVAAAVYWIVMAAYFVKSVYLWNRGRPNLGKDIVVATTAVCWYVGIITFNSDYAFTVTNVIIHGVPYFALIYWYMRARRRQTAGASNGWIRTLFLLMATVWLMAYAEELIWDRAVWHDRGWLFGLLGGQFDVGAFRSVLVPLLAVPQLTHYILDGFIWKRKHNPNFRL